MKCIIPAQNVKVLSRAIHSLAKIGDELHIEPLKEGLSFRTVNSRRSAYAEFIFAPSFFSYFKYDGETDSNPENEDIKCKISMKSCLTVFRSSTSLDKNVETCQLRLDDANENLIFELRCRYGIKKTHFLPIIECEALQAVFTKDNVPNHLVTEAKVLTDATHNFRVSQDEITLSVNHEKVTLSTFVENAPDPTKVVRTELCLNAGEFDVYSITEDTSIIFRLKDLRALLSFGDVVNLPVSINFESTGRPVVFSIKATSFEANFVLATLSLPADTQSSSQVSNARHNPVPKHTDCVEANSRRTNDAPRPSIFRSDQGSARASTSAGPTLASRHNEDDRSQTSLFEFQRHDKSAAGPSRKNRKSTDIDTPTVSDMNFDTIEEPLVEDVIPTTPPSPQNKRARFFFKRCFESTFDPRSFPGYDNVLAEDSGDENDLEQNV